MAKPKARRKRFDHAMADTAEMFTDTDRIIAHEATLQLKMNRGDRERARSAASRYALSLGRDVLWKTVLASDPEKRVAPNA